MNEKYFGEFDWKEKNWGGVPEQRIIFGNTIDEMFKYKNLPWEKDKLNKLIEEKRVIVGKVNVLFRQHGALANYHSQKAYQFTEKAEDEWQDILAQRYNAFDFSEVI